jgi:WD40 repeat protein
MLCYVMLCYVKFCYVMLCFVMFCCVMLYYYMLCYPRLLQFAPSKDGKFMVCEQGGGAHLYSYARSSGEIRLQRSWNKSNLWQESGTTIDGATWHPRENLWAAASAKYPEMSIVDVSDINRRGVRQLNCAGMMENIYSMAFANEHSVKLVTGGKNTSKKHVVSMWDVPSQPTNTGVEKLPAPTIVCGEHSALITGVCTNKNTILSCSEDARICCSDVRKGELVWTISNRELPLGPNEHKFNSICMNPTDENVFLVGMNKGLTHKFLLYTYDFRQQSEIFSMFCGNSSSFPRHNMHALSCNEFVVFDIKGQNGKRNTSNHNGTQGGRAYRVAMFRTS